MDALLNLKLERQADEADGIEHVHNEEDTQAYKEADTPEIIDQKPYDQKLIRVDTKPFSISYVESLITSGDLDLAPDFQREFVWTDITRKSRLIESLMLRIPLPVFYLAQDDDGMFKVVDGIQRLTVIHSFLNNEFRLKNLEYLTDLDGKWYRNPSRAPEDSIPQVYIRRVEQTQLFFNIIDPQAPEKVKYDIFKRINTGGKSLNAQEIRNCLSSQRTRNLLKDMVNLDSFRQATRSSIRSTRMADKEIALRFAAFYLLDNGLSTRKEYRSDMDGFLDEANEELNRLSDSVHKDILNAFDRAMENAYLLFHERAFRKSNFINKSLFLSLSRILYRYPTKRLEELSLGSRVRDRLEQEIKNNPEYNQALSMATNDARNVSVTLKTARDMIGEFCDNQAGSH